MKLPRAKFASSGTAVSSLTAARCETPSPAPRAPLVPRPSSLVPQRAFTLIEIGICLAIIGFALVAIIGVLPLGMDTQRQVREETDINQDFSVLLEAIRSGASGPLDLTNYILANTLRNVTTTKNQYRTNSRSIVGILSYSGTNHIQAQFRSLSGLAAQKPPQTNSTILGDSFTYQVTCVNVPAQVAPGWLAQSYAPGSSVLTGTNAFWTWRAPTNSQPTDGPGGSTNWVRNLYLQELANNLRELRMTILWPRLPNNKFGSGRQTFRATIAGQLKQDTNDANLWFYQPQTFAP